VNNIAAAGNAVVRNMLQADAKNVNRGLH